MTTAPAQSAPGVPADTSAPAANGSVDCATVKTAAQQLLMVQFLAQLRNPDTIEQIRSKQIGNLDLDTFLAAMHELHALDAYNQNVGTVSGFLGHQAAIAGAMDAAGC